ncbi:uncharacterized protein METZ01_LOCUS194869, partial [marine metagenome]
ESPYCTRCSTHESTMLARTSLEEKIKETHPNLTCVIPLESIIEHESGPPGGI